MLRLSYYQRIRDMMPESYAELIPAPPEPIYKYTSEGASKFNIFFFLILFRNFK